MNIALLEKELTEKIIGACFEVSNELGAGFGEAVYHRSLLIVLGTLGVNFTSKKPLTVYFKGQVVGEFQPDVVVEDRVILELKAVKALVLEHEAQVLNYMKATGIKVGLLINFGRPRLEWKRFILTTDKRG